MPPQIQQTNLEMKLLGKRFKNYSPEPKVEIESNDSVQNCGILSSLLELQELEKSSLIFREDCMRKRDFKKSEKNPESLGPVSLDSGTSPK